MKHTATYKPSEKTGRWTWTAVSSGLSYGLIGASFSLVSFRSQEDARADFMEHLEANDLGMRSGSKKPIRTKDQIAKLIKTAAECCDSCAEAELSAPRWHEMDVTGANWEIAHVSGANHGACLDCMNPVVSGIRDTYNIPDEGDRQG